MSLRAAVVATVIAGCGTPSHPAAPVPENHSDPQPDPRSRADAALRDEDRLDYGRPFGDKSVDRSRSTSLYQEACRGGDKAACWIGMQLASPEQWQATAMVVEANCKAGDALSCRALPADDARKVYATKLRFPSSPGAVGRSVLCVDTITETSTCDREALRRECTEGFPASCRVLAMSRPPVADEPELMARAVELGAAGCRANILSECEIVNTYDTGPNKLFAEQRLCDLGHSACDGIGALALRAGDQAKARDAYERACQLGPAPGVFCMDLATSYLEHKLVEPVPGRGQALLEWSCARGLKELDNNRERLEKYSPECKGVTLKQ